MSEGEKTGPATQVDEAASPTTAVSDTGQLRGAEFGRLVRRPVTIILLVVAAVLGAAFGAVFGPLFALVGLAVALAVGLVIVLMIASSRARDAFFDSYATSRGFERDGLGSLGSAVPFLTKGDSRRVDEALSGEIGPGIEGHLCLYTYTEVGTNSEGNRTETDYPFTVVMTEVPEVGPWLPELLVRKKSGFKALEGLEDSFRRNHERVTLESEAMRDRYEIFVRTDQDPVWVRELFSPTFIVWMTETPPKDFAFELVGPTLCCFVPKHRKSAAELDEFREVCSSVVERLREEVAESTAKP